MKLSEKTCACMSAMVGRDAGYTSGLRQHLEGSSSMVAKVRGLPGFILTLPKYTLPCLSSKGLMKSLSPMETPPAYIAPNSCATCTALLKGAVCQDDNTNFAHT